MSKTVKHIAFCKFKADLTPEQIPGIFCIFPPGEEGQVEGYGGNRARFRAIGDYVSPLIGSAW